MDIVSEKLEDILATTQAHFELKFWARGKSWREFYASARPSYLLWLYVRTQHGSPQFRQTLSNILYDILIIIDWDIVRQAAQAIKEWGEGSDNKEDRQSLAYKAGLAWPALSGRAFEVLFFLDKKRIKEAADGAYHIPYANPPKEQQLGAAVIGAIQKHVKEWDFTAYI